MRVRFLPAIGISAFALVAAATLAPDASASHSAESLHSSAGNQQSLNVQRSPVPQTGCRYGQTKDDTGKRIDSTVHAYQDIDSFSTDDEAIDDFQCNSKEPTVVVTTVTAWGFDDNFAFGGFFVTIYKHNRGTPVGDVVCDTYGGYTTSSGSPGIFKYVIAMPGGCTLTRHAKYWLELQANDGCHSECSYFTWSMLTPSALAPAYWRNPKGGWGRGCLTWRTLSHCLTKDGLAYDLAFAI